jgi:hypothetical protein
MKAIVKRDIDIKNEEVAEKCCDDFVEHITMDIQDFLMEEYDIDYNTAEHIACSLPKDDFVEIIQCFIENIKADIHFK